MYLEFLFTFNQCGDVYATKHRAYTKLGEKEKGKVVAIYPTLLLFSINSNTGSRSILFQKI